MMRVKSIATFLLLFSVLALYAQKGFYHSEFEKQAFQIDEYLPLLFAADPGIDLDKYSASLNEIDRFVAKLDKKRHRLSDEELLEQVFYKIHNKKLAWYEQYGSLADLIENKKYDCLTGTALYAIILDKLDIKYAIFEFDYHVLLMSEAGNQLVMFESTDPLDGFINNDREISKRLNTPVSGEEIQSIGNPNSKWGQYKGRIDLRELAGLQYYNQAIKFHNQSKLKKAAIAIEKAHSLYPSNRLSDMKAYIQANTAEMLAIQ